MLRHNAIFRISSMIVRWPHKGLFVRSRFGISISFSITCGYSIALHVSFIMEVDLFHFVLLSVAHVYFGVSITRV